MKKMTFRLFAAALAVITVLSGCANEGTQSTTEKVETETPIVTEEIPDVITDASLPLAPEMTLKLTADQLPADAALTWSSSDPEKAQVDDSGNVTAHVTRGTVTVTASAGEQTQSWQIKLGEKTPYGVVALSSCDEKLTIGVWTGSYHWFDEEHMKLMADGGIDLLIGIADKWIYADGPLMLDQAQQYGVSIIADLRGWDYATVPEYAEHPALKGFLLFDEPGSIHFDELASSKEIFEELMPEDVMFFINLFPEACSYESLYGEDYSMPYTDYEEYYLKAFVDTVDPACISYDAYALQEGGLIRDSYYHNFDVAAKMAKEKDIPFWYTLLSAGHSTTDGRYITPTDAELRWQMALGMCYGSDTLVHYILSSRETEDYVAMLEYLSYEPTQIFYDAQKVNLELRAWQDIFMSYDWVGTAKVDVGKTNSLMSTLEYDLPFTQTGMLTGVDSQEDLLVGVFENAGENAYLLVNAGDADWSDEWLRSNFKIRETQATLQLAGGDYRCAAVIQQGKITYVPVSADNTVSITIGAYDSAFVIPVLK